MKVLHIIDSGGLYGAEVMLLNLMQEQVWMGIEPILASIGDPAVGEKKIEQEAYRLGLRCKTFRFRPGPNVPGAFNILRFAWQEKIDILHSHGYKGNILFGFLPKQVRRMPMISTVHGWTWTGGVSRMLIYERLDALALRRIERVVLVNGAMLSNSRLQGSIRRRLSVIENGITSEEPSSESGIEADPLIRAFCESGTTIGALGRLSREKGFDLLIDAVASLLAEGRDIRLVILGEGDQRPVLEEQVRRLGIGERVLMPGYRPHGQLYLPYFHLFAISSLTEGLPMVLLEAMRAVVPIVATRVGGIPDVLQGGKCGLLMESGSQEALVLGIRDAINNRQEALQRASAARERVLDTYSSRAMAEKYQEIYDMVLK